MNMVLLAIIAVLLIVCLILIILIINNKDSSKKVNNSSSNRNVYNTSSKNIDISDIEIPKKIELMGTHSLFQACKKVYESFKALDYSSQDKSELNKVEWHSWQVSLLIGLLKSDRGFFIPKPKEIFHSSIIDLSYSELENKIQKILQKYGQIVNLNKTRDDLSQDIAWSSSEVSIIFYYMVRK